MSAGTQPLLMLSPSSAACYHTAGNTTSNVQQTTPKLPKRERLASFSRLVASENFTELMPDRLKSCKNIRRKSLKKFNWQSEDLPNIRVSPGSPPVQDQINLEHLDDQHIYKSTNLSNKDSGCLEPNKLPFSPNLLWRSPKYASPSYQLPTPMRSPLYISEQKGVFLGRGSFGNVTLCTYKGIKFALKVVHHRSSFIGEHNFVKIRHPHLIAILHIATVLDKVFICMEFAGHCNLQQVLDTKSELDFPRRLSFCIQIASGLRHCHQRHIVHGDVKPANVIVSPYGVCKLGDFGQSINLDLICNDQAMPRHDIVGTAAYAAPEVLRGGPPSLSSDIYSFGILLWQVQTRELPFSGDHPHIIIYKVAHYRCRPVFESTALNFSDFYEKTAECCWHEDPPCRLTATEVLRNLQEIEREIKINHVKH